MGYLPRSRAFVALNVGDTSGRHKPDHTDGSVKGAGIEDTTEILLKNLERSPPFSG